MNSLTDEHIRALDDIGMRWDTVDYLWERNYNAALEYYHEHGDLDVPASYISPDRVRLWDWINKLRKQRQERPEIITDEQIRRLDEIGMLWGSKKERQWDKSYSELCRYKRKYGNVDVSASFVSNGVKLYAWLDRQRRLHEKGADCISEERIKKLEALGIEWKKESRWEKNYKLAKKYFDEHGTINIKSGSDKGLRTLQLWVNKQKRLINEKEKGKTVSSEQLQKLEAIGLSRDNAYELKWKEQYAEAKAYFSKHHDLKAAPEYIGTNGKKLYRWLDKQRNAKRRGKLSDERIKLLDDIGMIW